MSQNYQTADDSDRRGLIRRLERPGGTSGGLGSFLIGGAMAVAGIYLIMQKVQVSSGYWPWWGQHTFGLTLVPLLFGIGFLFFDGRSIIGWLLSGAGLIIILAGILLNLRMYVPQTSLFDFLLMFVLFVGGLGLMARSLRSL